MGSRCELPTVAMAFFVLISPHNWCFFTLNAILAAVSTSNVDFMVFESSPFKAEEMAVFVSGGKLRSFMFLLRR